MFSNWINNFIENENRNKIILFSLGGVLLFGCFMILVIISLNGDFFGNTSRVPQDAEGTKYNKEVSELRQKYRASENESYKVTELITKLPYGGNNFTLNHDYASGQFRLILNQNNSSLGLEEFSAFLKKNGVRKELIEKDLIQQTSSGF